MDRTRRQGGRYGGDSGGGGLHAYGGSAAQPHQQHQNSKSGYHQGRHQEQQTLGDKERDPQHDNQWRWERDGAQDKLPQTAMSPAAPFSEAPRSNYQNQTLDPRAPLERQAGVEDMDIGYEE
ncbi:hypothetical protein CASFOL_040341 [Castilleja foliolosa]|uniref:Uncharacterized protein n=1 Tax=Castilleja foliolosa TaxID=1961234 RepID=A0ABD3BFF4_9LAMI